MNPIYNLLKPFAPIIGKYHKFILSLRYRKALGRSIEKKNPKSFYDKIFWLSCNSDTTEWSRLADKYLVREFIKEKIGEEYLPQLYGVYDSADEIDFDKLPNSFVIKTNNGCASNFLVRDKKNTDLEKIRKELAYWLKFPYGELTGQRHYSRIKPRIIAEEFMYQKKNPKETLIDYKFYCFNGIPTYCNVISERVFNTHKIKKHMYDMNWKPIPDFFNEKEKELLKEIEKPITFEKMKEIANVLAKGFKFVRVDLYEINGEIKFGEMTFMPGMDIGWNEKTQYELGSLIKID